MSPRTGNVEYVTQTRESGLDAPLFGERLPLVRPRRDDLAVSTSSNDGRMPAIGRIREEIEHRLLLPITATDWPLNDEVTVAFADGRGQSEEASK